MRAMLHRRFLRTMVGLKGHPGRLCVATILALSLLTTVVAAQDYPVVGPGKWFLRVTNLDHSASRICVRVYFNPNVSPWWGPHQFLGASGISAELPAEEQWLTPGATSEWMDIGSYLRPASYARPILLGVYSAPERQRLDVIVELASGSDKKLARRLAIHQATPPMIGYGTWYSGQPHLPTVPLLLPLDPDESDKIITFEEATRQQLQWIDEFPAHGQAPRKIVFVSYPGCPGLRNQDCLLGQMHQEIAQKLGYNAPNSQPRPEVPLHWSSLGDEIGIHIKLSPEEQDGRFRLHLQRLGVAALDCVRPEDEEAAGALPEAQRWGLVRLVGPLPPEKPKLFYQGQVFRYQLWAEELGRKTRAIHKESPMAWVGANFSTHITPWPDVRKWLDLFKRRALTMPWSEDWWWGIPVPSPQGYGFLLDALRRAAQYNGGPFQFYTIPQASSHPEFFYRMNCLALAHGAKIINHFRVHHQGWGTCDWIQFANSQQMYHAIYDVIHEVGALEDRLYPAWPQPARVAILLSRACDVWDTEDLVQGDHSVSLYHAFNNAHNYERMALWLALRHAQVPVDIISDADVAEGSLADYRVLYMVGPQILRSAAEPLAKWVRAGGILFSSAGGGLVDEYLEPLPQMAEVFGLEAHSLQLVQRHVEPLRKGYQPSSWQDKDWDGKPLKVQRVLDQIQLANLPGLDLFVLAGLGSRQTFQPQAGALVVGRWSDGEVGAILNDFGKGKALIIGTMPGLAYLRPAMTGSPWTLPTDFPTAVRDLIVAPTKWAGVQRPLVCSEPLVEATYMVGSGGTIVPLINFAPEPISHLTVAFPTDRELRSIRSLKHGALSVSRTGGVPQVTLPLALADFLLLD